MKDIGQVDVTPQEVPEIVPHGSAGECAYLDSHGQIRRFIQQKESSSEQDVNASSPGVDKEFELFEVMNISSPRNKLSKRRNISSSETDKKRKVSDVHGTSVGACLPLGDTEAPSV